MRVFTNNQFSGHWPIGTASVVVAENSISAANLLNVNLKFIGLPQQARPEDMIEISLERESCRILADGNY